MRRALVATVAAIPIVTAFLLHLDPITRYADQILLFSGIAVTGIGILFLIGILLSLPVDDETDALSKHARTNQQCTFAALAFVTTGTILLSARIYL